MTKQQTLKKITAKAQLEFSDLKAIIFWGSGVTRDWDPKTSDLDLLLVVEKIDNKLVNKINKLVKKFTSIDLDILFIEEKKLSNKNLFGYGREDKYPYHKLDQYNLKYKSWVIFGDKKIIDKIQPVTFEEAMLDILPYVIRKTRSIQRDLDSLGPNKKNLKKYIQENISHLQLIMRTVYNVEKGRLVSKSRALDYWLKNYCQDKEVSSYIKKICK